jgi:hypothetical protein
MLRPSPVSRLLAARDLVYAHFQLQMECESINKRRALRGARKLDEDFPENEKKKKDDLESQGSTGLKKPLYVTSDSKAFFRRMKQTFNDARSRRALVCASTAMISQQLTGINTISKHCRISKYSKRQVFASPYAKAISRFPWTDPQHTLPKLISFLCTAFLSATLLRTVNASDRTGAWVGFGIGLCNFA